MDYKVIFHKGESINLKDKATSGIASLTNDSLVISGNNLFSIKYRSIDSIKMTRLNGLGRMIKISLGNENFFISVYRVNFFGYFAIINFFKTGDLFQVLQEKVNN